MTVDWNQPQPAPRALWSLVHSNFTQTKNLGIFQRRNVAGTNAPSAHAEGRALDIGLRVSRTDEKLIGDELFKLFIKHALELGLDHVIWNGKIWSRIHPAPHLYLGHDPHADHIHVAFTREGSQRTNFPRTVLAIAVLRTGLGNLAKAWGRIA